MQETRKIYALGALAAACALALTVFAAGAATPATRQDNNNGGSNANANGNAGNANRNRGGQSGATGLSSADRQFVARAAMMDLAEIELGRLAVGQGATEGVKQFGQRMIDDHTRTSQQLMQIASTVGVTPPTALDAKHRAAANKLSRLTGAEFDRAFMKQMVKDHQEAVSLYQRESTRGVHPDLRTFAAATLPALQEHLTMARSMAGGGSMNHGGNSNSNSGGGANSNSNSNR